MSVVANTVLTDLENKIDISIYFQKDTPETTISQVRKEIEALGEVEQVDYISADEALVAFKEKHKDDPTLLTSLEEFGDENPLSAALNIKAYNTPDLPKVAKFIQDKNYASVEKVNYFENQKVIDRLTEVINGVRATGVTAVLILAFIAVLVAFNTVRLAIYTAREEINIMKLVGATNWYVRGPFMIEGLIQGTIAAILTALAFWPLIRFASPRISFLTNVNIYEYFFQNFLEFFVILFVVAIVLGVSSSLIAIRRYLKI